MSGYDVFISFKATELNDKSKKTRDYELASDLHQSLLAEGINTFFSAKDLEGSSFSREIDEALEQAKILIVVGTKREHMESKWVVNEWNTFKVLMLSGRKPGGQIYTYLEGVDESSLPGALVSYQSYQASQKQSLINRVKINLGSISDNSENKNICERKRTRQTYKAGDIIEFGQYPQRMNGELGVTEPIKWRVLVVEDGKALIITEKLLEYVPYNEEYTEVTWETCTLRKWMNEVFYKKAFCRAERERIAAVKNVNYDNEDYSTPGGNDTEDKIFALSLDEVKQYFRSDSSRVAGATEYAYVHGEQDKRNKGGFWWLRSPGLVSKYAALVSLNGDVSAFGLYVNYVHVIARPALWLAL